MDNVTHKRRNPDTRIEKHRQLHTKVHNYTFSYMTYLCAYVSLSNFFHTRTHTQNFTNTHMHLHIYHTKSSKQMRRHTRQKMAGMNFALMFRESGTCGQQQQKQRELFCLLVEKQNK